MGILLICNVQQFRSPFLQSALVTNLNRMLPDPHPHNNRTKHLSHHIASAPSYLSPTEKTHQPNKRRHTLHNHILRIQPQRIEHQQHHLRQDIQTC